VFKFLFTPPDADPGAPPEADGVPLGPDDPEAGTDDAGDPVEVPEIALDPRPAGPSGVSETEFDLEELTAEGVEDPDIVDSPSIDRLCVLSIKDESLAVDSDPDREDA
jgi:hypothetical protein